MLSKAEQLPSINGQATQGFNIGRSIDPFTNQVVENQTVRSNSFSLNGGWTLFNGFSIQNTIDRNRLQLDATEKDMAALRNDLALQVASAYLQAVQNREIIEATRLQLENTRIQLARTQRLVDGGVLPATNAIEIEAQVANEELRLTDAQNQYDLARLQLVMLMQLPDLLPENMELAAPEIAVPDTVLPANPKQVYQTAETTLPQIAAARINTDITRTGIQIAKADRYPSLTFGASTFTNYSSVANRVTGVQARTVDVPTSDPNIVVPTIQNIPSFEPFPFFGQLDNNLRYGFSFNLNIPIYNNLRVKRNVAVSEIQQKQSEVALEQAQMQLNQEVLQAWYQARAALNNYRTSMAQVRASEVSADAADKRFAAGISTAVELNLARNNLLVAKVNLIQAKYRLAFRQKVLDFYEGKPID